MIIFFGGEQIMTDHYANTTNLGYLIEGLDDSVPSNLETYALTASDNEILSKTTDISITNTPALIQQAAEYFAMAFILRKLYDTSQEDTVSADWYEKKAKEYIGAYASQNLDEDSDIHPYSSSQTPATNFTRTTDLPSGNAPATSQSEAELNRRKILNNDTNTW